MQLTSTECVAGHGHTTGLWFKFHGDTLVGYCLLTSEGTEVHQIDEWFIQHMATIKVTRKHLQASTDVLPYLTFVAGDRAVKAVRDYNVYDLAIAFTSHYGWQLINGAKILPTYGELAKVYCGMFAVYLFKTNEDRELMLKVLDGGPKPA